MSESMTPQEALQVRVAWARIADAKGRPTVTMSRDTVRNAVDALDVFIGHSELLNQVMYRLGMALGLVNPPEPLDAGPVEILEQAVAAIESGRG